MTRAGIVVVFLFLFHGTCRAQEPHPTHASGSVTGRVTTMEGEPIAFANVVLVDTDLDAVTNTDGRFTIHKVPPGSYRIRVTFTGYVPIEERIEVEERRYEYFTARLREQVMATMPSGGAPNPGGPEAVARYEAATKGIPSSTTEGMLAFGLDLFHELDDPGKNLCFSPFSVYCALAMVHAGARGSTADEIARALGLGDAETAETNALLRLLSSAGDLGGFDARAANRLWIDESFEVLDAYTTAVREHHEAEAERVPFTKDPDGALDRINAWVSRETNARIPKLLSSMDPRTQCVLTAALYLNAPWSNPFSPSATNTAVFKLSPEDSMLVPMMQKTSNLRFADVDGAKLLELPYAGDALSLVVLLPDEGHELGTLERDLATDTLHSWLSVMTSTDVRVSLPKFRFRFSFSLVEALQGLGMKNAFSAMADFSRIAPGSLFLSDVVHESWISVDEQGTEAAVATAVILKRSTTSLASAAFHANRPFLFLIRDRATGTILFLGRVTNPLK